MSLSEDLWELLKGSFSKAKLSSVSNSKQQRELERYYKQCKAEFEKSKLSTKKEYDFSQVVVSYALDDAEKETGIDYRNSLPENIIELLFDITATAVKSENFFAFPEYDFGRAIPLSKQIEIKKELEVLHLRSYEYDGDDVLAVFFSSFANALCHFLYTLGDISKTAGGDGESGNSGNAFGTEVLSAASNLPEHLEQMIVSFFNKTIGKYGIFENLRERLLENADVASGFKKGRTWQEREEKLANLPTDSKLKGKELVDAYLKDTYLKELFDAKTEFVIPEKLRFEHCHILAGTGHGKTQLLQKLIIDDLIAGRGFMVIDSQGQIIQKLAMFKVFDPLLENNLSDKLIIIDPEDVDFPASLNMFALNQDSDNLSSLQKQMLINSTVDLYEYIFGALFGAELTSKQGVIFRYIAKLMAEIPNATIHTLRELLENGKAFAEYMEKLDGSASAFFKCEFFSTSFGQTKRQILSRLWSVLSNQTLENLFSSKTNKIDLFEAMNEEKIVLINTSKQLLQTEGSAILGRFFIALLAQASIKRASLKEEQMTSFMVYIDEAQEYIDEKIEVMLNQARKYKVGFTLSHQNLHQLGGIKDTVFSSTSIKLAGGVSAKDAKIMADEMKTSADFLLSMEKDSKGANFGCFLKNVTKSAVPIWYEFGLLEREEVMDSNSYDLLYTQNREKYCGSISDIEYGNITQTATEQKPKPKKEKPKPKVQSEEKKPVEDKIEASPAKGEVVDVPAEGKGGTLHRYLQNLVKKKAQDKGFLVTVESKVFDGTGSVDVELSGYDKKIAVEVSVTTDSKWEASNISKCLSADYDMVAVVSDDPKHLARLETDLAKEFKKPIKDERLVFCKPSHLFLLLDKIRSEAPAQTQKIRGYEVSVKHSPLDDEESKLRQDSIAKILLKR